MTVTMISFEVMDTIESDVVHRNSICKGHLKDEVLEQVNRES